MSYPIIGITIWLSLVTEGIPPSTSIFEFVDGQDFEFIDNELFEFIS